MNILIIGGTRFIGPFVVRSLATAGHDVTIFHRGQTEADLPGSVRHIHCDDAPPHFLGWKTYELPKFVGEFKRLSPDVVLDMVPEGEKDAAVVMDACRGVAGRVVALSSQDVYRAYGRLQRTEPGPPDSVPFGEDAPLREKFFPYRSEPPRQMDDPDKYMDLYEKILVERIVMGEPSLPGTILRLPMVYGPRDNQHRLFPYLKRMDDNRPAILFDEGTAQWRWTRGYVENVADAVALAITNNRAAGCIYNVGEPQALSMGEWVRAIGHVVGWQGEVNVFARDIIPESLIPFAANIDTSQHLVADTTRIRTELGYSETIVRAEALKRSIAWERANPPADVDPKHFDYDGEDAFLAAMK